MYVEKKKIGKSIYNYLKSSFKLATNDYTKALAGEEGAEKLGEVSHKHKKNPYLGAFSSSDVKNPQITVSRLDSGWGFDYGLRVVGYAHGDGRGSYAFGVQASDEVA